RHYIAHPAHQPLSGETQHGAIEEYVFPAGHLRVKSRAKLDQRSYPPPSLYGPFGRPHYSGDHSQQGAFSGPILTDYPENLAASDFEVDVAERPELVFARAPPLEQANRVFAN